MLEGNLCRGACGAAVPSAFPGLCPAGDADGSHHPGGARHWGRSLSGLSGVSGGPAGRLAVAVRWGMLPLCGLPASGPRFPLSVCLQRRDVGQSGGSEPAPSLAWCQGGAARVPGARRSDPAPGGILTGWPRLETCSARHGRRRCGPCPVRERGRGGAKQEEGGNCSFRDVALALLTRTRRSPPGS
jgi:hypothetical protein